MAPRSAPAGMLLLASLARQLPAAEGLQAVPATPQDGSSAGEDSVMALAAYSGKTDVSEFYLSFVNTLRGVGFQGNIFLGMWEGTKDATGYLERARVTPKFIRQAECKLRYPEVSNNYATRNICTEDFPHMKLDNARWIYGRRWLEECSTCTGWTMYADFGDINFQQNPFDLLPDVREVPPDTVYMTEEMLPRVDKEGRKRGVSTSHWLVGSAVGSCYGAEAERSIRNKPMLNIASSFGTRAGMLKWLGQLEQEFEDNSNHIECDPVYICDQGVLNHLFYNEQAMQYATPKPYGKWIVNTMGIPCSNQPGLQPDHSLTDIVIIDSEYRVWNEDGSLPAVVHQGKACWNNYDSPFVHKFGGAQDLGAHSEILQNMTRGSFPVLPRQA